MTKVTITLNQWENLSVQAYVREAEQMSKRTPENKDLMLAVAIIRDDIRRHEVSFAIRDRKVTFKDVIDLTKAADRSVGDSDPFGVGEDKTQHNHRQYLYLSSVHAMPPPSNTTMVARNAPRRNHRGRHYPTELAKTTHNQDCGKSGLERKAPINLMTGQRPCEVMGLSSSSPLGGMRTRLT